MICIFCGLPFLLDEEPVIINQIDISRLLYGDRKRSHFLFENLRIHRGCLHKLMKNIEIAENTRGLELEKIRFQDTLKVEFNFSEIQEGIQIAPMLLIPFVENAFKHGELTQGFLRIRIDIRVENLMLDFSIKNSVLSKETEENENGIGLENFRKRLDLNYKDNYRLEKSITDGWYIAHLRIPDLNKINNG